jgi:hypothetical protein
MTDDNANRPASPIPPRDFLKMVPSSRASPNKPAVELKRYRISVQLKSQNGRWSEIYRFTIFAEDNDFMADMLNFGLKERHRVLISEESRGDDTPPEHANEPGCVAGDN